jgi:hypothetical protein
MACGDGWPAAPSADKRIALAAIRLHRPVTLGSIINRCRVIPHPNLVDLLSEVPNAPTKRCRCHDSAFYPQVSTTTALQRRCHAERVQKSALAVQMPPAKRLAQPKRDVSAQRAGLNMTNAVVVLVDPGALRYVSTIDAEIVGIVAKCRAQPIN